MFHAELMDVIVHVIGPVGWSSMSCGEPAAQRHSCSSKTSSVSRPDPDPARIMLGGLKFGQISTAEESGGSNETSEKH